VSLFPTRLAHLGIVSVIIGRGGEGGCVGGGGGGGAVARGGDWLGRSADDCGRDGRADWQGC
jgi:hypothetical protein